MNEWTLNWIIVARTAGLQDDWPKFAYKGQTHFHIHDARHHLAALQDTDPSTPWEIAHAYGYYPAPEWLGAPSHFASRHMPRMPKPENFTAVGTVPPDHEEI